MATVRRYRAGESIEDHCRACHEDRTHAVIVVDAEGRPLRVSCGFCGSQHNYRGGPRMTTASRRWSAPEPAAPARVPAPPVRSASVPVPGASPPAGAPPRPQPAAPGTGSPVPRADHDRPAPGAPSTMTIPTTGADLEALLRRVVREEAGLTPAEPADKWRGGELVLRPGRPGVQEKSWPIDTFFHKIVMIRNRLRTLEQQVNASELPDDQKVKLQAYVTACYGTLTSFNALFASDEDRFSGSGQD